MQTSETTSSSAPAGTPFSISESAAARINHLKKEDGQPDLHFRVAVKGGGCSGFQYEFSLETTPPNADDSVVEKDGAEVLIDETSMGILAGSMLDYTEDLAQAGFVIKNPNATASCGCGNSFSVAL
jgi:iron-sulfur cluster insertion protein